MTHAYHVLAAMGGVVRTYADSLGLSDTADHVGFLNRHERGEYPYFGVQPLVDTEIERSGIGNADEVAENERTDEDGNVVEQDACRLKRLTADVGVVGTERADGVKGVMTHLADIEDAFRPYTHERSPADLHPDVREIHHAGTTGTRRPDDTVLDDRVTYEVVYVRTRVVDVTPIRSIDFSVEVSDDGGSTTAYADDVS